MNVSQRLTSLWKSDPVTAAKWVADLSAQSHTELPGLSKLKELLTARVAVVAIDVRESELREIADKFPAAEFSNETHPVRRAISEHRDWFTEFLETHLQSMGHPTPGAAADELYLLRDGAMGGGYAGDPVAATSALHRAAERILDEAKAS